MKPAPFEYHVPDSLAQALSLMHEHADAAKLLAGGQSLVPAMNFRVVQPSMLIDLNRVNELNYVRQDGDCLRIGAMTRERTLEYDMQIEKLSPLLHEASPNIAHPQIRNRGTIGGSLVNADPAAELPVVMTALKARLQVQSVEGRRWIDAQDFFVGMFTTALQPNEILVEIEVPVIQPRTGWSFMEVAPRAGDYALLGVACVVSLNAEGVCRDAMLVYLNAGDGPVDAREASQSLIGKRLDEALINTAAEHASEKEIHPFGNVHTSPEFQRHLAKVLTMKTLRQAIERAGENL